MEQKPVIEAIGREKLPRKPLKRTTHGISKKTGRAKFRRKSHMPK